MKTPSANGRSRLHSFAWLVGIPLMIVVYFAIALVLNLIQGVEGGLGVVFGDFFGDPLLYGIIIPVWILGGYFWAWSLLKLVGRKERETAHGS